MRLNHRHAVASAIRLETLEPKGTGYGVGSVSLTNLASPLNPVESITLKVQNNDYQERDNLLLLSGWSIPEQVLTASSKMEGLSQKRTPNVMVGICRQTHDGLDSRGTSSNTYV